MTKVFVASTAHGQQSLAAPGNTPPPPPSLEAIQRESSQLLKEIQNRAFGNSTAPDRNRKLQSPAEALPAPAISEKKRVNPLTSEALTSGDSPSAVVVPLPKQSAAERIAVREDDGLISLMVRDGSLRQVVALIAETQKLNLVFAGSEDVQVTASFDRVPWQQVLDAVLAASGHTSTTVNDVIFVSSLDAADFINPGADGRVVKVFELDFAAAVDIHQGVTGMLSQAGKTWILESNSTDNRRTREAVVVVDYPSFIERVDNFISQSDQPPRQVFIEAHILKVELSDDCRSGVNFQKLMNGGEFALRSAGFANGAAAPAFFIESTNNSLSGLIELLKTTTDAKTLASPKIHAVNGQESHIQIGDQLGFRNTIATQTSSLQSTQFLDVGVVLRVTPRITRDGRVLMRIKPEVSTGQINPDTQLPSKSTAEVETDVMLHSGQGMVIGGLIQETDSNIQSKIPLLGDIPYLGVIFQKRTVERSRSEIIVTLIPHVLPYEPILQERNDCQVQRTLDPLTQGAIYSTARPYEPKMSDPLTNPHRVCILPHSLEQYPLETDGEATNEAQLQRLPPVTEQESLTTDSGYEVEYPYNNSPPLR